MFVLRIFLGTVSSLGLVAFVPLTLIGAQIRSSFGASPAQLPAIVVPPIAMIALLTSVIVPEQRVILHGAALTAVALAGLCIYHMITEAAVLIWVFAVLALWVVFYVRQIG